jgi:hypothetical protein
MTVMKGFLQETNSEWKSFIPVMNAFEITEDKTHYIW